MTTCSGMKNLIHFYFISVTFIEIITKKIKLGKAFRFSLEIHSKILLPLVWGTWLHWVWVRGFCLCLRDVTDKILFRVWFKAAVNLLYCVFIFSDLPGLTLLSLEVNAQKLCKSLPTYMLYLPEPSHSVDIKYDVRHRLVDMVMEGTKRGLLSYYYVPFIMFWEEHGKSWRRCQKMRLGEWAASI